MACKKCNDCLDNGCAPTVYPKCLIMDKKYPCLGVNIGDKSIKLFDAIEAFVCNPPQPTPPSCPVWNPLEIVIPSPSGIPTQILKDTCGNISIRGLFTQTVTLINPASGITTYGSLNISTGGGIFATLPVGFRPGIATQTFPVYAQLNLNSSTLYNTITYVTVLGTGEMYIQSLLVDGTLFPNNESIAITLDLSTIKFSIL